MPVAVQLLPSVTVTLYAPAAVGTAVGFCEVVVVIVPEPLHKYV